MKSLPSWLVWPQPRSCPHQLSSTCPFRCCKPCSSYSTWAVSLHVWYPPWQPIWCLSPADHACSLCRVRTSEHHRTLGLVWFWSHWWLLPTWKPLQVSSLLRLSSGVASHWTGYFWVALALLSCLHFPHHPSYYAPPAPLRPAYAFPAPVHARCGWFLRLLFRSASADALSSARLCTTLSMLTAWQPSYGSLNRCFVKNSRDFACSLAYVTSAAAIPPASIESLTLAAKPSSLGWP